MCKQGLSRRWCVEFSSSGSHDSVELLVSQDRRHDFDAMHVKLIDAANGATSSQEVGYWAYANRAVLVAAFVAAHLI